jgi:hypothetical protein
VARPTRAELGIKEAIFPSSIISPADQFGSISAAAEVPRSAHRTSSAVHTNTGQADTSEQSTLLDQEKSSQIGNIAGLIFRGVICLWQPRSNLSVTTDGVTPAATAAARLFLFTQLTDRAAICRSSTPRRLTAHNLSDSRPNKTLLELYAAQAYCAQSLRPSTEQDTPSKAGLTPRDHKK